MKLLHKSALVTALFISTTSFAQNGQWQVQINTSEPAPTRHGGFVPLNAPPAPPTPAAVNPADIVQSIQTQQEQRIRWGAQRGYITEPEFRRLQQMQANIEHNRRIAYGDGYFNVQEQQFVYGQLNTLSAEIDTLMLNGNYALPYFQQFNAPTPVWVANTGWVVGKYDIRADTHHARAYRAAPQPPAVQVPPQGHPHRRNHLRDLLDSSGLFR